MSFMNFLKKTKQAPAGSLPPMDAPPFPPSNSSDLAMPDIPPPPGADMNNDFSHPDLPPFPSFNDDMDMGSLGFPPGTQERKQPQMQATASEPKKMEQNIPSDQSTPQKKSSVPSLPDFDADSNFGNLPEMPSSESDEIPAFPEMPGFDDHDESSLPQPPIPSFPMDIARQGPDVSKMRDMEVKSTPLPMPPTFETKKVMDHEAYDSEPRKSRNIEANKPIFVRVDEYIEALDNVNFIRDNFRTCDQIIARISDIEKDKEEKYDDWRKSAEQLQKNFMQIDKILFSGVKK